MMMRSALVLGGLGLTFLLILILQTPGKVVLEDTIRQNPESALVNPSSRGSLLQIDSNESEKNDDQHISKIYFEKMSTAQRSLSALEIEIKNKKIIERLNDGSLSREKTLAAANLLQTVDELRSKEIKDVLDDLDSRVSALTNEHESRLQRFGVRP